MRENNEPANTSAGISASKSSASSTSASSTPPIRRASRASLSSSPLARPANLIHMLASQVQQYIYFPVPDSLYVVLGTVAANMLVGTPVWVMLVGSSSSGKTLALEMLAGLCPSDGVSGTSMGAASLSHDPDKVRRVHIRGALKSPAAMLSGTARKDQGRGSTGGLLREIGEKGLLVTMDFTSMLTLQREVLHEMIGVLRDIFDGRYSRTLGVEGGRTIKWQGKVGFLGAVTPAIDRHSALIGEMGERWAYYRFPETDGYGETMRAMRNRNPAQVMEELRGHVVNFFDALDLGWDKDEERREYTSQEMNRFYAMGALCVAARSGVPRDMYQGWEVNDIASREGVPRLAMQLGQLYLGMERIGVEEGDRWRIIGKVALDSVRKIRMVVLLTLQSRAYAMKAGEIQALLRCGTKTVELTIGDLVVHGLVKKEPAGRDGSYKYKLSKWAVEQLEVGWGGIVVPDRDLESKEEG